MARSGTVDVPIGGEGSLSPTSWLPLASVGDLADGRASARSVRVRVSKASYSDPLHQASLPAGVWWQPDDTFFLFTGGGYFGLLRFQYGYRGMLRTLYCDLRSGEYQIPPCEFLRVETSRYTPAVSYGGEFPYEVDHTPYQVEAEIADGVAADFTPMLFTAPSQWDGLGEAVTHAKVAAPPGAYAFDICPEVASDSAGNRFETRSPASIRDFVDGVWLPPSTPLPLIHSYVEVAPGSQARNCNIVFFVR